MSKYELIESMGLDLCRIDLYGNRIGGSDKMPPYEVYVRADDLLRIVSQAPVVYGAYYQCGKQSMWATENNHVDAGDDTHTARLLCVEPIVRDTAESLLRELCAFEGDSEGHVRLVKSLQNRARRLLGDSK